MPRARNKKAKAWSPEDGKAKETRRPSRGAWPIQDSDIELRERVDGLIIGMTTSRWSWWTHWRELADYILPRRYRWLITPNMQSRGSPINQHILDSTATIAARDLAAGMFSGTANPNRQWFRIKIGRIDTTQTSPASIWLAEVQRLLLLILHDSGFYNAYAIFMYDEVVFGSSTMICYEDFENVVKWFNPCLGEFFLANDANNVAKTFGRQFTYTVQQTVDEFGLDNVSDDVYQAYTEGGASLTREIVIAHLIEPNDNASKLGFSSHFTYREVYWQWGGSAGQQGGSSQAPGFLRKKGFHECPFQAGRWDLVSNDPYGRCPGMDALPDTKQLQLETRRKAQGIDKQVNPPLVADIQLKNQPASLLPGGVTYIAGMLSSGKPGFAPVYTVDPKLGDMKEDIKDIQTRIRTIFYNPLFQTASQFETRSNITTMEWDMRKSEAMTMLGPVIHRNNKEVLANVLERVFAIAARAGVFPPPPPEISGKPIEIEYVSILNIAQQAAQTGSIERVLSLAGNLAGVDPAVMDNIDIDFALDKMSDLLNNDPRMIRSPDQLAAIRQQRQQQAQQQQQADMAEKMAGSAQTLSQTDVGGGKNALQALTGAQ